MSETPLLKLPLIAAAQAQKHVTHNEALKMLDALVQITVISMALTAPPGAPSEGDRYIAASGATGAWASGDLNIFLFTDGAWLKIVPLEGWKVYDLDTGSFHVFDGAEWQLFEGGGGREQLTADRTYFVNGSTGDDGNDGLSAGSAFATIQKAVDSAAALDLSIFDVTIEVAAATYGESVQLKTPVGAGTIFIEGDRETPANVTVSNSTGACFHSGEGGMAGAYHLSGMKLTSSAASAGHAIHALGGAALILFEDIDFGACAGNGRHMLAETGGRVVWAGGVMSGEGYTISGGAQRHMHANGPGSQIAIAGCVVEIVANIGFGSGGGQAFASAQGLSGITPVNSNTYNLNGNSVTGMRYFVAENSLVRTNGGGASYFPGDVAGTAATGGTYT